MKIFRFTKKNYLSKMGYYFKGETQEDAIAEFQKQFPNEPFEVEFWNEEPPVVAALLNK